MMNIRTIHAIAFVLRKFRLLQCVDWIYYIKNLMDNRKINKEFISNHSDFPVPPAHLVFDSRGNVNWKLYFNSGIAHAKIIADIIKKEIKTDHIRIFEWGCGPGRIIRHLKGALGDKQIDLYGSDYNAKSVEWCQDNIEGIKFFVNQIQPPLPFEANSLDCLYAISVFTHLSEAMHFEWIREILRVVKPNGLIIITTHGDSASDRLLLNEKQSYDSGKLIVRGDLKEGKKWYLAYHPPEFIRNQLLEACKIVYHSGFELTQDIWAARK